MFAAADSRFSNLDRGAGTALNKSPARKPDAVVEEKTLPIQAALYRLSGDVRFPSFRTHARADARTASQYNPLHVDPSFAAVGGFEAPILHGLAFFGISGKHIYKTFGAIKDIKVRFVGSVYPGETLVTEMWKDGNKVTFGKPLHPLSSPPTTAPPEFSARRSAEGSTPLRGSGTPSLAAGLVPEDITLTNRSCSTSRSHQGQGKRRDRARRGCRHPCLSRLGPREGRRRRGAYVC